MNFRLFAIAVCLAGVYPAALYAQGVTRESLPGVTNFARVETTIACAGATTPAAVAGLKKMGYAAIVNLREAGEPGAEIEAEAAAAKVAGINFVHLPFNSSKPEAAVTDKFLQAITERKNNPAFVHCSSGNRAAAMWMIKRMLLDRWDAERAGTEAAALGLTNSSLKTFALDYVRDHRR